MSILIRAFIMCAFVFGVWVGFIAGRMEWDHEGCVDSQGTYTRYEAWLSVRHGVYRCFWIEKDYPHRVKLQGVIDVK
jgi:hypothetical protein